MEDYLRTKQIKIGDRNITVKEISVAAQLRLEEAGTFTKHELIRESLNKEDWEFYSQNTEKLPRWLYLAIDKAIGEVNMRDGDKAPVIPAQPDASFREDAAGDTPQARVEETPLVPH